MAPFPNIHMYISSFLAGLAVSTVSLWVAFLFFDVDAPLRQALWMSLLVSFVNLIPFVEHFFAIPLLAFLLYRRGNLSANGIIVIVLAWLTVNTAAYAGLQKYMGFKFSLELPGMLNLTEAVRKFMGESKWLKR